MIIDKQIFLRCLTTLPIHQEELLGDFLKIQEVYPASVPINMILMELLKNNDTEELGRRKNQLLLTLPDRQAFYAYQFETGNIVPVVLREEVIDHLIEQFSNDPPKIKFDPNRHDAIANYGKLSLDEDPDLISETLAMIYAEQGFPGKAIKMYKKLSLLFPGKSCYFAIQIENIKKSKDTNSKE
ncbi:MAG: hypothetical protein LBV02_03785 [Bacteroidales bacterium]|jgi:hypothetical protein|nr:hypothetical protein [Bacteroidales bacterium]